MIEKIEHIGIAVKNLDSANKIYEQLLDTQPYKFETVDSEGVNTSFFKTGESKVELLQATKDESAIAKFIANKESGIRMHIGIYTINGPPVSPARSINCAIIEHTIVNKIQAKNSNKPISLLLPAHLSLFNK